MVYLPFTRYAPLRAYASQPPQKNICFAVVVRGWCKPFDERVETKAHVFGALLNRVFHLSLQIYSAAGDGSDSYSCRLWMYAGTSMSAPIAAGGAALVRSPGLFVLGALYFQRPLSFVYCTTACDPANDNGPVVQHLLLRRGSHLIHSVKRRLDVREVGYTPS